VISVEQNRPCPLCGRPLQRYPRYYYCFRCSKQFRERLFGRLEEIPPTIGSDQKKAMGGKW